MATQTGVLPGAASQDDAPASKKGRKKKLPILAMALVLLGAGAYLFLGRSGSDVPPPPEPGQVLKLDPITLNLADGHFLKLGLALQFTTAAEGGHGGGPDGSRALDLAIEQLSNRKIVELNSAKARTKAKKQLAEAVEEAYHHAVMDIYFTEFVMQ
jgi:flagellar FliL protein